MSADKSKDESQLKIAIFWSFLNFSPYCKDDCTSLGASGIITEKPYQLYQVSISHILHIPFCHPYYMLIFLILGK